MARIGTTRPTAPDEHNLRTIQERHVLSVPFENVDCFLRRPLRLGEGAVEKIVHWRRGGGCYELNSALGLLLESLGYPVTIMAARVYHGDVLMPPMRHLVLRVDTPAPYLVDVGFGFGQDRNSLLPLRFDDRTPQHDPFGTYQLADAPNGDVDVLREGKPLYRIERHPRAVGDFEHTLWWFHTARESPMLQALFCVLPSLDGRVSLKNDSFVLLKNGERNSERLEGVGQVRKALSEFFGIEVDAIPDFMRGPEELSAAMAAAVEESADHAE
ncbi:arylamine N-acetyltransferase [Streptomyces sp. NPDC057499]|uniref:arylamine N-acetyltransferase family protein n=1 Tax=Streptomyces sp. NPDC057499 TaxID=3346150 RepID=UPI0036959DA6